MTSQTSIKSSFAQTFSTFFSHLTIFICVSGVVVATVAGPFGTFEAMSLSERASFWVITVPVSIAIGYSARAIALVLVPPDRPYVLDTVAVAFMTVVFGPMAWGIAKGFEQTGDAEVPDVGWFFLYVFVVTAAVFLIRRALPGIEPDGFQAPSEPTVEAGQPRLLKRLSPAISGDILRLSSRDHHVEVATTSGRETLRLRMADAIDEMEPVDGFCIHRSHWVARNAITGVERKNAHKAYFILSNGERLPISRTYRPKLEEMGLLD